MAICLVVKVDAKEDMIENEEPIKYDYVFGQQSVLAANPNTILIIPGDSFNDIKLRSVDNRVIKKYKKIEKKIEVIGTFTNPNQCVPYAWSQGMQTSGYHIAKNYPVQNKPTKFASTYEGPLGHIVVIEQDLGNSLIIRDAGYIYGKITRRIIPKSIIKGYVL